MPAICEKVVYISNTHQRSKVTEAISVSNVTSRFAQFSPIGFNTVEGQKKKIIMRHVFISLLAITLTACGPSQEEVDNTAKIACNIMAESREMDAAMRIREINAAREKIGADPYLEGDYEIKESIHFGLCERLVKNDPEVLVELVKLRKELVDKRIAELQEELRIAELKKAEEQRARELRLAKEVMRQEAKAAEERRKKREKAERDRIANEKRLARQRVAIQEALEKYGVTCPTPSELLVTIDQALAIRDSSLVKKLQKCPGPYD